MTTRTHSAEKQAAANAALRYLRAVNRTVGPINSGLASAFSFSPQSSSRRGASGRFRGSGGGATAAAFDGGGSDDSEAENDKLTTPLAGAGSLWSQGRDFWDVLGWAFNTSVRHRHRWVRWKLFLEVFLEILEADWAERMRLAAERIEGVEDRQEEIRLWQDELGKAMLCGYLADAEATSRNGRRKILRAVLADGGEKARAEFREVWRVETERPKAKEPEKMKHRKLNVDADDWGDYDEDEDEEYGDAPAAARPSRKAAQQVQEAMAVDPDLGEEMDVDISAGGSWAASLGGMQALLLRQRFITLVSR